MEDFIANLPLGVKGFIAFAALLWVLMTPDIGRWFGMLRWPKDVNFFTEIFPGVYAGHRGGDEE